MIDYSMRRLIAMEAGRRFEQGIGVNPREKKWIKYHREHPFMWKLFCSIIHEELLPRGLKNFSSTLVVNHIRWLRETEQLEGEKSQYKIDDHLGYSYSRWFSYKFLDIFPNPCFRFKLVQGEAEYLIHTPGLDNSIRVKLIEAIEKAEEAKARRKK